MTTVAKKRHIAKALTWRALASTETFLLGWLITGRIELGLSISAIELFSKTCLYYFHERVWHKFKWGVDTHETSDNGV